MSCSAVADEVLGAFSWFLAHSYSFGSQRYEAHQHEVFSVYTTGKGYLSHPKIANTVQWPRLGYEWHFSFCAKLNSTVVFSSLLFYFWVLKQLPGCVTHSPNQSYEQLRELMMSEMPFFLRLVCQCVSRGYSAHARSGQELSAAAGEPADCEWLNIDRVPGTHVKLSMTRPWTVCRWHGSCCMPFPWKGGNRKYGMTAKQHAVLGIKIISFPMSAGASWQDLCFVKNKCKCFALCQLC